MNKQFIISVLSVLLVVSVFLGYKVGFSPEVYITGRDLPFARPQRIYTHPVPYKRFYADYPRRHRWRPYFWWDNLYDSAPWGPCPGDWCPYR